MLRFGICAVLLLWVAPFASAQQQDVFPDLSGEPLREALALHFKTDATFSYDRARDSLFAAVYYEDGTVRCVYTDWPIEIDLSSSVAPRTQAWNQNVNTEHTWPQSLGAGSGHARSDLHHLFPTREDANSSRSNHPFAEIPTAVATRWWYLDQSPTAAPPPPHGIWSKTSGSLAAFEPRDEHKGRVARAMFYFYTMYEEEADLAAPLYLDLQKDVLFAWHETFPPDEQEHLRTQLIAGYQGGNPNPFVIDTSLIRRAYFSEPSDPFDHFDAIYTFEGTSGCDGQANEVVVQPEHVTFSPFSREGVVCNAGADVFNSRSWPAEATLDPDAFVEFSLVADTGRELVFNYPNRLVFGNQRSNTGPAQAEVRFSTDGDDFETLGAWEPTTGAQTLSYFLPAINDVTEMTIRFYGWSASSGAGTMRFDNVRLTGGTVATPTVGGESQPVEASISLSSPYPNPASHAVTAEFAIARTGEVTLSVYDLLGRRVAELADGVFDGGNHAITWDPAGLPAGVYIIRLVAAGQSATAKVALVR